MSLADAGVSGPGGMLCGTVSPALRPDGVVEQCCYTESRPISSRACAVVLARGNGCSGTSR